VQQQAQPRPSAPAGKGGQNQADTVAAKPSAGQQGNAGSGGDAEVARYPSQVVSKLRRALRYPRGGGGTPGEVHVQFTVSAGGQPSGIRVVQSSGNAAIDQAGIDTVTRAAPFPPIPAGANRNSWAFTVPLAFVRG
jgi:protein TonB